MDAPFKVDEWVVLREEHDGLPPGTSVRISKTYNSPRIVEVTCPLTLDERVLEIPTSKLKRRGERKSLLGRLRT